MASIDDIISGVNGNTRYNFAAIGDPVKSFFDASKERADFDARRAFRDGVPTDANGQPDFAAMGKALFQHGDVAQGTALSNLALQRQQLQAGQAVAAQMGNLESGGQPSAPQAQPTIVSPPSGSRNASTPVAPPLNRGGVQNQGNAATGSPTSATIPQILTAQGFPNDQIGALTASLGRQLGLQDPTQPINPQDPQIRNVLIPAIQQFKRMGVGQVAQPGQPAQQEIPQVNPQQNQGTFGAPLATPTRGSVPTGNDPEIQKQIALYTYIASNPAYPKNVQEAAQTRLKALQDQVAPTGDMKEYDLYRRQGGTGSFQDFLADNEQKKAAGTEEAKVSSQKYQTLVDAGVKAQQEIPQLEMLQSQMNDPNFYSGVGEKYSLLAKRLKSAVGIDPDAAVPQELLRKVTASSVLGSFGALKGLGPIRVAEMKLAQQAAAAPENSIPANKLLVELQKRTYQRQADIAEMAQNYKEQNGVLDPGFDKQVTAYFKSHPMFTDTEIKNFHTAIDQSSASGTQQRFATPADVHAAISAGRLKKGDSFQDANGVTRYVP